MVIGQDQIGDRIDSTSIRKSISIKSKRLHTKRWEFRSTRVQILQWFASRSFGSFDFAQTCSRSLKFVLICEQIKKQIGLFTKVVLVHDWKLVDSEPNAVVHIEWRVSHVSYLWREGSSTEKRYVFQSRSVRENSGHSVECALFVTCSFVVVVQWNRITQFVQLQRQHVRIRSRVQNNSCREHMLSELEKRQFRDCVARERPHSIWSQR